MVSTTACVMSSSVVANSVSHGAPRAQQVERTLAYKNVLLSSRRLSSIAGVSVPLVSGSSSRREPRRSLTIVAAKATKEPETTVNETSVALDDTLKDVLKSVQEAWEKTDDKLAVSGLGFAGLLVLWASAGLIGAIDKLPLIPNFFELVGILFSGWFVYRYLLFKPDREELLKIIDDQKAKITESTGVGKDA